MREDLTREELVAVIDRMVDELLEKAGVQGPPVDALALAERHLGMVIRPAEGQPQRGRAPRGPGPPTILVRPEAREEQQQWVAAQAIGQHLKPSLLACLGLDAQERRGMMGESLAGLFANRLLVPTAWFAGDAPAADYDVAELRGRYRTAGFEVVALRLLDLPEPCIITVVDNDHVHRRRSNAWRVRRELSTAERECQRYVNHYSRPKVVRQDGWTVQGWPAHEPDWKREILRSVVEEGEEVPGVALR